MNAIVALHGFLGDARDWRVFEGKLRKGDRPLPWIAIDLWQALEEASEGEDAFENVSRFLRAVAARVSQGHFKPILLGYSMGGRLAMRAFGDAPDLFAGAIFVSANPGLPAGSRDERDRRAQADERWALRFESEEPWELLLRDWNAQPALLTSPALQAGAPSPERRRAYARALRAWSLSHQPDLREPLANATSPSLWLSGREDLKFSALMAAAAPQLAVRQSIAGAGHRVPWDRPIEFLKAAQDFITSV